MVKENKVALITGAGAGIGKAIALRLARDGFDLALNDLNAESVQVLASEIRNVTCLAVPADVSDKAQVAKMVEDTMAKFGRIDILVNNAGILPLRTFDEISVEDFERSIRINLFSVFICTKAVAPYMIKQGKGKIINAASQAAYSEGSLSIEYGTSKWGIRGLTRTLASSLAAHNITVNAYCPGKIVSTMQESIEEKVRGMTGLDKETYDAAMLRQIPLGRYQTVDEIAGLVSFLAGPESDAMTGQNILMNGGQIMC